MLQPMDSLEPLLAVSVTIDWSQSLRLTDCTDTSPSRAVVLIKFAQWLTKPEQNNGTWVTDILWPAIDTDLQWILLHWNQSSYVLTVPFSARLDHMSPLLTVGIFGPRPFGQDRTGRHLYSTAPC